MTRCVFVVGRLLAGCASASLVAAGGGAVRAHDDAQVGDLTISIGWAQEPALTGVVNAVEVTVTGPDGAGLADLGPGLLTVEVTFGNETTVLGLVPDADPGRLTALLTPTQVGTYTFHVAGYITRSDGDQPIDVTTTCSEHTFECVIDAATIQFPSAAPGGQLAERVDRAATNAEDAKDDAAAAQILAITAIVIVVLGVGLVGFLLGRRRSVEPSP